MENNMKIFHLPREINEKKSLSMKNGTSGLYQVWVQNAHQPEIHLFF